MSKPFIVAIIPARMSASRFPGKPMAKILGIPMIGHVYLRSKLAKSVDLVCVATCDREIFDYITSIGGKAVMTSDKHERASDRCAECMEKIEQETKRKVDIVVMIQGDEPLVLPEMIDSAIVPVLNHQATVVNLCADIDNEEDFNDPNEIKVVFNKKMEALYFSRRPIPHMKSFENSPKPLKQVCIIPFTREALIKFGQTAQTTLEKLESIDMMRIIENGDKVQLVYSKAKTVSVDNQDDLVEAEKMLRSDSLFSSYKN